jgi:CheY-like chemotaxis protein
MTDSPILVIDDEDDALLVVCRALDQARVPHPIVTFSSGRAARDWFASRIASGPAAAKPILCLLDVRMPEFSGYDLLQWIRQQRALDDLVVVMLSQIDEAGDMQKALKLGAHSYLLKYPVSQTLGSLARYAAEHALATRHASFDPDPVVPDGEGSAANIERSI